MQGRHVIRAILFVLFFSIGAASLSISILCDDLVQYYQNTEHLRAAQESLDRLKSLNADYDILLEKLQSDPNLVKRLAPAALGPEHQDANTVYPRATAEQLAAARRALMAERNRKSAEPVMPKWLSRCRAPRRGVMLFICGVVLILTSFICFGPAKAGSVKSET
ncbi:MAG: hypothetical protein PVJ86_00660 [Phycisphaerales bacterium]|jgi:hypothetical protein